MRRLHEVPDAPNRRQAKVSSTQLRQAAERRKADPEPIQAGGREKAMRLIEKRLSCTNLRELLRLIPDCFENVRRIDITIQNPSDSAIHRRLCASVAEHPGFGEYIVFEGSPEAADVNVVRTHLSVERSSGTERIGAIEVSSLSDPVLKLRGSDDPAEAADVFRMITALIARTIDASLDGLTLLATRKCLDDSLRSCGAEHAASGRGFSLILIDIDHFKDVNDSFGHKAGDLVLANVAGILLNAMRGVGGFTMDSVGRHGGEEFLIILQDVRLDDAAVVAERLRKAIREHAFSVSAGTKLGITCSFGVAESGELEAGLPAERAGDALLALADSRLYCAKKDGRDRVEPQPPGALRLVASA